MQAPGKGELLPSSRPSTYDDLRMLVENQVPEGLRIDYKLQVPRETKDREEFAKDVAAFANRSGGFLVYGVREENRLPVELVGDAMLLQDFDRIVNSLDQVLSANVEPRIVGTNYDRVEHPESQAGMVPTG